jgi:hypothetical protein
MKDSRESLSDTRDLEEVKTHQRQFTTSFQKEEFFFKDEFCQSSWNSLESKLDFSSKVHKTKKSLS